MRHKSIIAVVGVLALAVTAPVSAESVSVLLEKGIHLEETVGDLDAAIKIYEQIVADAEANRRCVAQAQFRLGVCYLTKGDKAKAAAAFKRLLSDFPQERSLLDKARRELGKLGVAEDGPPVVLRTAPAAFADNVPASLEKITVTFDQPMMDGSWSWTGGHYPFPETRGSADYDARKTTCTLPVKLEPGKVYWVGINSPSHKNFQTRKRVPAQPYVILFATRAADGKPTSIPEKMLTEGKEINSRSDEIRQQRLREAEPPKLELNPAPWADGEIMRLKINSMAGVEIGTVIYTAELAKVANKDAWRIESFMAISLTNMQQFTRVHAERESFAPITGRTRNTATGDFQAQYGPGKVKLAVNTQGKSSTRQVELDRVAYDNEQALYLIRRMPLAEGYHGSFPIFPVIGGSVVECRIEVTGKEKVTVAAGTYECYKTDLSIYSGEIRALQHQLWFSADKHQYLVKYDSGEAIMELAEIGMKKKGKPTVMKDRDIGLSVTLPEGWWFYKDPAPRGYRLFWYLLPPELKAWVCFTVAAADSQTTSAREVAQGDADVLKDFFKNYAVRPASWADVKVAGLPAARYAADYQDKDVDMVEYRTYILGKSLVYWFVFRIEKDKFDASRPEFDSIVDSFKAK